MFKHSRGSDRDTMGIFLAPTSIAEVLNGAMGIGGMPPPTTRSSQFAALSDTTVEAVQRVLQHLSECEEQVVRLRYGIGTRLHSVDEVSDRLGLVPVQVSRIEVRAFRKLREASVVGDGLERPAPQSDPFHSDNRHPTPPVDPRRRPDDPERDANPWDEV